MPEYASKTIKIGKELFYDYDVQPNPPSWLRRRSQSARIFPSYKIRPDEPRVTEK